MKFASKVLSAVIVLMMAGCAGGGGYCLKAQPYDKAESIVPITATSGLSMPQSATALNVPPAPKTEAPYGVLLPGGRKANEGKRVQCLDEPPPLPVAAKLPSSS